MCWSTRLWLTRAERDCAMAQSWQARAPSNLGSGMTTTPNKSLELTPEALPLTDAMAAVDCGLGSLRRRSSTLC